MNLQIVISNRVIESQPIDEVKAIDPHYLSRQKKALREKYNDLIITADEEPVFYLQAESIVGRRDMPHRY
jgi:hypothetical protein